MTAVELIRLASQGVFALVFVATLIDAIRRPTLARIDTALFFGAIALAIVLQRLSGAPEALQATQASAFVVMTTPYLLLRLLDDFAGVKWWVKRAAEAGLILVVIPVLALAPAITAAVALPLAAYFVLVAGYATLGFVRVARTSPGITRRRMQAVATGSALLAAVILVAGLFLVLPPADGLEAGVTEALSLASALFYFAGFATPRWLRRYWREPELRAFVGRAGQLPRLPDTASIVADIERHVGASLGAGAAVGLWDPTAGVLRFGHLHDALPDQVGPSAFPSWRAFSSQAAMYVPDAAKANPASAEAYRAAGIRSMLVAPISAGERRLGVLVAYSPRPPIFAEEDLAYVQLLADQASVVLESRALIDEAARVRAHEEAARLKEDFISAAAHDLRTPLTTLLGQAELLEQKFRNDPQRQADLPAMERMSRMAGRLSDLVQELLEAAWLEQGRLELLREDLDLARLATAVASDFDGRVNVEAPEGVVVDADPQRLRQVLRNLVENALKYSAGEAGPTLRVWVEGGEGRIAVQDHGIGIPEGDLPRLFQRFQRASNVNDRSFAGIGLGLYICRGIVEKHGGRIWAESVLGRGSTFHVALPLSGSEAPS